MFLLICACIAAMSFSSCVGTQTFTVHGAPGTQIYKTDLKELGVIDQSGKTEITLSRIETCMPLLLAKAPEDVTYTPFALDFEPKDLSKEYALAWGGFSLGMGGMLCGELVALFASVPVGLGLIGAGVLSWVIAIPNMNKTATMNPYCDNYDYLPNQSCNSDIDVASRAAYNRKMEQLKK